MPIDLQCIIPIRLPSSANLREHWAVKARRANRQRKLAANYARAASWQRMRPKVVILTRRYAGRARPFDDDNLVAACKAIRDGLCDVFQIDDADSRVTWRYRQESWARHEVLVELMLNREELFDELANYRFSH